MLWPMALAFLPSVDLPKLHADVLGTYVSWRGFANYEYRLLPKGKLTITVKPDHPGSTTFVGNWKFAYGTVSAAIEYRRGNQLLRDDFLIVPIVFGDRLMLVDAEELQRGVVSRLFRKVGVNEGGRTFGSSKTDLPFPVRVLSASSPLPKIYGMPKAPEPYHALLSQ
jgi:hypothetical protein